MNLFSALIFFFALPALSFAASPTPLIERSRELDLSHERGWLKLAHYVPGVFGGLESQAVGPGFFMATNGRSDPQAELEATLLGFFEDVSKYPDGDHHPICRFPARLLYLESKLGFSDSVLPHPHCAKYEDYLKRLEPSSVSLVFSSFYLNNPSSAFGHSFLKINSRRAIGKQGELHELLDFGVNYAANVTTENPILYALFGTIGAFNGTFTSVPYYYKVREYNDYEARDLWSYDLALTEPELRMLTAHLWELGSTYYRYYYFTQNCSYHMFTTLEAAAPRLHLTDKVPLYVIPSDTMRALMREPGLVTHISFRPSVRAQFEYRLKNLSDDERDELKSVVLKRDLATPIPPSSQARVLDTALDYLEFSHPENLLKENTESSRFKQQVLIKRASLGVRSEDLVLPAPEENRPDKGHGVRRFTLGQGWEFGDNADPHVRAGGYTQIAMRLAMHDMLDPSVGYPKASQIEFVNAVARYQWASRRTEIEELTLFRVTSLSPLTAFRHDISFNVELGYERVYDRNCNRCGAGTFEAGPGEAIQPFGTDSITLFGFLDGEGDYSPSFHGAPARLGAGPTAGVLLTPGDHWRLLGSGGYRFWAFSLDSTSFLGKVESRYILSNRWAAAANAGFYPSSSEVALNLMYYW